MKKRSLRAASACLAFAAWACTTAAQSADPPKASVITRVQPEYPPSARRAGIEGAVVAWVRVDAEGNVRSVRIRRSPHEALSDAAEAALLKWKFKPMEREGKPVAFTAEYLLDFKLTNDEPTITSERPPSPGAAEVSKYVAASDGVDSFRNDYWKAPGHKAFASSDEGSWGWTQNNSTAERAAELARENCERYRRRFERPCKVVDIDGAWDPRATRQPTPPRLLPANELLYFRSDTVQGWPEEKKKRVVPMLEQCRHAADAFMETLKTADADTVYKMVSQELRDQYSRAEFAQMHEDMKRGAGTITANTFQREGLIIPKRDEETLTELQAEVIYTAVTSRWKSPGVVLALGLVPGGDACRVSSFVYFVVSGELPPWLREGNPAPRGT